MDRTRKWRFRWAIAGLVVLATLVVVLTVMAFQKVSAPVPAAGETPGYEPSATRQVSSTGGTTREVPSADNTR